MNSSSPSSSTISRALPARNPRPLRSPANSPSSAPSSTPRITLRVATAGDAEIAQLRAQIDDLETKLALYRRREQLDLEYNAVTRLEEVRLLCAPIMQAVCREFDLAIDQLLSLSRAQHEAFPRMLAVSLCREFIPHQKATVEMLATIFRRSHHTTVCWAIKAIANRCATDPAFAARVAKLRAQLVAASCERAADRKP